jgi:parallel beta-helix repeat protein
MLVVGVVTGSVAGAATAGARTGPIAVQCGDTVTTDVTLTADLDCTGTALTIGAANVTIDLGGHVISGTDTSIGIVGQGFDGITIRDGALEGFAFGVDIVKAERVTVEDLEVTSATTVPSGFPATGLNFAEVDDATISGNRISRGQAGISFVTANDVTIDDNTLDAVQTGVQVLESTAVRVTGNTMTGNAGGISLQATANTSVVGNTTSGGISGIYVLQPGILDTGNVIDGNTTTGASSSGIFVDAGSGGVALRMNRADRNFTGMVVRSPETTLTTNAADDNTQLGIDAIAGVVDGGGNTASGNGDARQCVGVVCGKGVAEPDPNQPGPTEPGPTGPPSTPLVPLTPPGTAPPAPVVHATPRFTG